MPKEYDPIDIYFSKMQEMQHRKDDKVELTRGQIEYVLFLGKKREKREDL
jgi:hypothetical protein